MEETKLESVLVKWAQNNDYVIGDRIYRGDLIENVLADSSLGFKPPKIFIDVAGEEAALEQYIKDLPEIERHIYTPTGCIEYLCFTKEGEKKDIRLREHIDKLLKEGELSAERIVVYHGPFIEGWKRENIPLQNRESNSLVLLQVSINHNRSFISDDDVSIGLNPYNLLETKNPLYQFFAFMGNAKGRCKNSLGAIPVELDLTWLGAHGKYLNEFRMPHNKSSYEKILSLVSEFIRNSEQIQP